MQKSKLQIKIQTYLLIIGALLLPYSALASSIYIDTKHSEFFVGDTVLFNIRIDSEGKNINAVEGEVLLDHAAEAIFLTDINTSGSQFSLWPVNPLPSERNARISFAGGSPGGLTSNNAIVFNVVLKLSKAGQVALSFDNIGVYINDGKGTKDEVHVRDLVIDVLPNKPDTKEIDDWSTVILSDTTPPEPFEVYLGQEGSVFDGKKFLSFSTIDEHSGVSHYEVVEGNHPSVRSSGTYVLQEQDKPVKVVITAYDSAGNMRESVYNPQPSYLYLVIILVVIFVLSLLVFVVFKKRKKNDFVQK